MYKRPQLIVVAIPNTNRTRDLTPTHTTVGFDGKESEFLKSSGGGNKFLQFVREELFPKIESSYRTHPYRILVGHSFGGLLALHAFLDHPDMFQSFVAIDPSLWWDDKVLVKRAADRLARQSARHHSVFITLANNPRIGRGEPRVMEEAGRRFAGLLRGLGPPGMRSALEYFDDEDHGSVPLRSLYHGLLFTFQGYKPDLPELLEDPASLSEHFRKISERLGLTVGGHIKSVHSGPGQNRPVI